MVENKPVIFEISTKELNGLVQKGLGLTWGSGSLYFGIDSKTSFENSAYKELVKNEIFVKVGRILANPDNWIVQRTGGGQTTLQAAHIYHALAEGDCVVLVTLDLESDQFIINYHESFTSYTDWLVEHFCSDSKEMAVNFMPPNLTLSQFYIVLHGIDVYKRIAYSNMLHYHSEPVPKISAKEFYKTLGDSLASGDIRWLLPSVENLIPSLKSVDYSINPEDIKILFELDFLDGIITDEQGGDFVLSNIGIYNGIEFLKHWIISLGFEFNRISNGVITNEKQLYIAPTRFTNHCVEFEHEESGDVLVNHQVYTKELLMYKFNEHLKMSLTQKQAETVALEQSSDVSNETEGKETKVVKNYCTQCGNALRPEAKFCNMCGTPIK